MIMNCDKNEKEENQENREGNDDFIEYAVHKENEIPRIIQMVYDKLFDNESISFNSNKIMRKAEDIMKDYGLR